MEADLLAAFESAYPRIRRLPDCHYLALVRSAGVEGEYLTLSLWTGAEALQAYREGPLFAEIWPLIRRTLRAEPWATSFEFAAGDPSWTLPPIGPA